jgi:hypothetical protein
MALRSQVYISGGGVVSVFAIPEGGGAVMEISNKKNTLKTRATSVSDPDPAAGKISSKSQNNSYHLELFY